MSLKTTLTTIILSLCLCQFERPYLPISQTTVFCLFAVTGLQTRKTLCWSQARVNWSGCDEKGNQCKTGAGKLTGMAPPVPALTPARLKSRMITGIFTDVGYPPWAFSRASREEHMRVQHVVGAKAECRDFEGDYLDGLQIR